MAAVSMICEVIVVAFVILLPMSEAAFLRALAKVSRASTVF